jgi:hypothetical protein
VIRLAVLYRLLTFGTWRSPLAFRTLAPSIIFALRDFVSCSRTPAYVRGKRGIVAALHGSIVNPLDHRGMYPPLCSVVFPV